jgi:hypothetical protein
VPRGHDGCQARVEREDNTHLTDHPKRTEVSNRGYRGVEYSLGDPAPERARIIQTDLQDTRPFSTVPVLGEDPLKLLASRIRILGARQRLTDHGH